MRSLNAFCRPSAGGAAPLDAASLRFSSRRRAASIKRCIERLLDDPQSAVTQGTKTDIRRRVGRHDDDLGLRSLDEHAPHKLDSVDARQTHVGQEHVDVLLPDDIERVLGIAGGHAFKAGERAAQTLSDAREKRLVVLDNQNPRRFRNL
jgi:hypothetical protein